MPPAGPRPARRPVQAELWRCLVLAPEQHHPVDPRRLLRALLPAAGIGHERRPTRGPLRHQLRLPGGGGRGWPRGCRPPGLSRRLPLVFPRFYQRDHPPQRHCHLQHGGLRGKAGVAPHAVEGPETVRALDLLQPGRRRPLRPNQCEAGQHRSPPDRCYLHKPPLLRPVDVLRNPVGGSGAGLLCVPRGIVCPRDVAEGGSLPGRGDHSGLYAAGSHGAGFSR
mmetsp:Transcript_3756/g.8196  ORF Transcript_3756/g.8196 Transcript_3756/m.8196 type:complete len:223 (-) Transcript_3756:335-1003(-)